MLICGVMLCCGYKKYQQNLREKRQNKYREENQDPSTTNNQINQNESKQNISAVGRESEIPMTADKKGECQHLDEMVTKEGNDYICCGCKRKVVRGIFTGGKMAEWVAEDSDDENVTSPEKDFNTRRKI